MQPRNDKGLLEWRKGVRYNEERYGNICPFVTLMSPHVNAFYSVGQSTFFFFRFKPVVLYTMNTELKLWNSNPFLS